MKLSQEIQDLKFRETNTDQAQLSKLDKQLQEFVAAKEISKIDLEKYYAHTEEAMCVADSRS